MWRPIALVMAVTGVAAAQPPLPQPTDAGQVGEAPGGPPPQDAPPPLPAQDPAWTSYDDAFTTAASGNTDAAKAELHAIAMRHSGHPAGLRAGALMKSLEPKPADPNAPSKLGRGELVFWSTVGGASIGFNVCQMITDPNAIGDSGCDSSRVAAGVFMGTVGGSLAASVLLTRNGIRHGEAQLYNAAQTWGAWNGLAINDGPAENRSEAATSLGMHAAGLGAGLALWQTWRPSSGDVALTNTFWVWTSVMTTWAHIAIDEDSLSFRRIVLAGDAGLIGGMLASTKMEMSRGRTFLIDIGGVLGILGGLLVAVGVENDRAAGAALFVGTGAGLAIGYGVSEDWDAPKLPVSPTPIQGPGGSTSVGIGSHFTW